jgi:hypothetical protein
MRPFLQISVVGALLVTGCGSPNVARQSASLPVRYHNAQYGLTFFLPASWRGYTVSTEPFEVSLSSPDYQHEIGTEHLRIITLRNPQWTANDPYKDIPMIVYTRRQWDEEQHERLNTHAGGYMIELGHNESYVFGLPNRYYIVENDNQGKVLKGVLEAADIIEQNRSSHKMPPLYPEK